MQDDNAATLAVLDTPSNRGAAVVQKNPWQGSVKSPAGQIRGLWRTRLCAQCQRLWIGAEYLAGSLWSSH